MPGALRPDAFRAKVASSADVRSHHDESFLPKSLLPKPRLSNHDRVLRTSEPPRLTRDEAAAAVPGDASSPEELGRGPRKARISVAGRARAAMDRPRPSHRARSGGANRRGRLLRAGRLEQVFPARSHLLPGHELAGRLA